MRATLWKLLPGYFTPGTPLYNEEGGEILKGLREPNAAKRLLAESGYAGEPIICMAAQDLPHHKARGALPSSCQPGAPELLCDIFASITRSNGSARKQFY